jgi:hypothetical protein
MKTMRNRNGNRAIRSASIIVIAGALAAIAIALRHDHRASIPRLASAPAAATHESGRAKVSAEEPPLTLINLPAPNQSEPIADSDADDGEFFAIPAYDARMSINPALLAAQQLAAERAAFIATGSPGLALAGGVGSGAAAGSGLGSAQSPNAAGLELSLLSGTRADRDGSPAASESAEHRGWVLIAGGQGGGKIALDRAELFDPIQMNFVATGAMHWPRAHFVAADLGAGKTLVAGGDDAQGKPIASAELYDPIAGIFSATGPMTTARAGHTATAISGCGCAADGKILIAGGSSTGGTAPLASAELYDPAKGTFTATGAMNQARAWQTASLISSGALAGDILIAGGLGARATALGSAELYDPRTGVFTETQPMATARAYHTATWLDPSVVTGEFAGKILLAGGWTGETVSESAEVFDPAGQTFIPAGTMTAARAYQAAVLMPNGKVLIAGGQGTSDAALASAEIYDPVKETFAATAAMSSVHVGAVASTLASGSVLIAGGRSGNAEVYNPATGTFTLTAAMPVDVAYAAGAVLAH